MHVFVIRHGIAEEAAAGQADADRELTSEGERKVKEVAKGLKRLDIELERIIASPWRRSRQTAELLRPICHTAPLGTDLLCQSPKAELLALIADRNETTGVVGHEPWLGELVAWLAFGDTRHHTALELKRAGVVWLEGSAVPGEMSVRAILPPSILARVK